tara:strand:+ start:49 stop:372 length:324 start_codon:yes stop_codon:yes gene_type:complete
MSIVGAALRGFGRALKKGKGIRSSKTGAIKSVKPGVGGLKKSREEFESLTKAVDTGKKLHGKEKTHELLTTRPKGENIPHLTRKSGEIERAKKALEKRVGKKLDWKK